jgi:septum formation protein
VSAPVSPTLVLASASPRRRQLLALLVRGFEIRVSNVDERLPTGPLPAAVADVALRKARAVAAETEAGAVLAADTVVVVDAEVLGKPSSAADARRMLRRLRGRVHEVITGVAVVDATTFAVSRDAVVSRVVMANIDDRTIDEYVASGEPLDKAGAYAIQGLGGALVDGVVGPYTNVVGLPLAATRRLLAGHGVALSAPGVR